MRTTSDMDIINENREDGGKWMKRVVGGEYYWVWVTEYQHEGKWRSVDDMVDVPISVWTSLDLWEYPVRTGTPPGSGVSFISGRRWSGGEADPDSPEVAGRPDGRSITSWGTVIRSSTWHIPNFAKLVGFHPKVLDRGMRFQAP